MPNAKVTPPIVENLIEAWSTAEEWVMIELLKPTHLA